MRRGTTPTITITTDIDLRDYKVLVTMEQNNVEVDLSNTVYEDRVVATLTQAQTLALKARGDVSIQIRAVNGATALASNIMHTTAEEILKDGEIVDDRS